MRDYGLKKRDNGTEEGKTKVDRSDGTEIFRLKRKR